MTDKKNVTILRILYLIWMIVGIFSLLYVPSKLIIQGDATTTANNILSNQFLFSLGIGMCLNNARAVWDALVSHDSPFERTPKYGIKKQNDQWTNKSYRTRRSKLLKIEFFFFIYLSIFLFVLIGYGFWLSLPLFLLFLTGYGLVWSLSLRHLER